MTLIALAVAPAAQAQAPGTASMPDPRDQRASIRPGEGVTDVLEVRLAAPADGTMRVTFVFAEPLPEAARLPASASVRVAASPPPDDFSGDEFCRSPSEGDATLSTPDVSGGGPARFAVEGLSDSLDARQEISADRLAVTLSIEAPQLARSFVCAHAFVGSGYDGEPDDADDDVADAYLTGARKVIPYLTRAFAVELVTEAITHRLRYPDYLVRYVRCKRLTRVRLRCDWLAGGDLAADTGLGTIGWSGLDGRNLPRGRYLFKVRRLRLRFSPTGRVSTTTRRRPPLRGRIEQLPSLRVIS